MMLERIQSSLDNPIVKAILFMIIIFFIFAGYFSASLFNSTPDQVIEVNGEPITQRDIDQEIARRRSADANFDTRYPTQSSLDGLSLMVQEQLVSRKVLQQSIKSAGIVATDEEVETAIRQEPAFQENGVYSQEKAQTVLAGNGLGYRNSVAAQVAQTQFVNGVRDSSFILGNEVETLYRLQEQTRNGRMLKISKDQFSEDIAVDDAEIESYFQENQNSYEQPEKVAIKYVRLSADNITNKLKSTITDEQVKTYYDGNLTEFSEPGTIEVAHILIDNSVSNAEQKAADLLTQLKAGADFAKLAKEHSTDLSSAENDGLLEVTDAVSSDDGSGGTGWVPEFEVAALALTDSGQLSELVETPFGFHIIKLIERTEGDSKPLAEVSEQIKEELASELASSQYYEKQAALDKAMFEISTIDELAASAELEVVESALFERASSDELLSNPQLIEIAFSSDMIDSKEISDEIKLSDDDLIYIQVAEHQIAGVKPLAEVKGQITQALTDKKITEATTAYAEKIKTAIEAQEDLTELLAAKKLVWVENNAFNSRTADVDRELVAALFKQVAPQEEGDSTLMVENLFSGDVALIELKGVNYPDVSTLDEAKRKQLETQLNYSSSSNDLNNLLEELKTRSEIK